MFNKWQQFARLNGMSNKEFSGEVVAAAQACLAMMLNENNESGLRIISEQGDGNYELIFKKVG